MKYKLPLIHFIPLPDISEAFQTIDATDLDDVFRLSQTIEETAESPADPPVSEDDNQATLRTERPFFFRKIGAPQQDDFFHNSVLAGVFTETPLFTQSTPITPPPFFFSTFAEPLPSETPSFPSEASGAALLPPLDPSPPEGLMTPEELALLNKILVTDDMSPEGRISFLVTILYPYSSCYDRSC
jgi:hypothetical protein